MYLDIRVMYLDIRVTKQGVVRPGRNMIRLYRWALVPVVDASMVDKTQLTNHCFGWYLQHPKGLRQCQNKKKHAQPRMRQSDANTQSSVCKIYRTQPTVTTPVNSQQIIRRRLIRSQLPPTALLASSNYRLQSGHPANREDGY